MAILQIGEIFGHDTAIPGHMPTRILGQCPFSGNACAKAGKINPLGICTMTDGHNATAVCPIRFKESDRIFNDAAKIAFGAGISFIAVPEVRVLEVIKNGKKKKIGKVDYLIAKLEKDKVVDFAALEVQAVYISGRTIRPLYEKYLKTGILNEESRRRPDFRSSAQKRLMPQLALKVPIFRRWGKKFFVATDSTFFNELPPMPSKTKGNSEITWLSYPITRNSEGGYTMNDPNILFTFWSDVESALREGVAPEESEILATLTNEVSKYKKFRT